MRSIENFVDGVVSDGDDKTVVYTYNGAGMTSLTAFSTGGGGQTTQYVYGVSQGSGSKLDSNDIVGITRWPNASTGVADAGEQEVTKVNALGQTLTMADRNGSVHTISYDALGRVVSDAVTTLGSGVDGSVRRIETAYDGQGNAYLITSYNAAASGSIVNQVKREFNGLGQLTKEWQSHSGAVTSSTPKVQYAYSEMAGGVNSSRLKSITYASGYVLTFHYESGLDDTIGRLSSISDQAGTLETLYAADARVAFVQPGGDVCPSPTKTPLGPTSVATAQHAGDLGLEQTTAVSRQRAGRQAEQVVDTSVGVVHDSNLKECGR